MEQPKSVVTVAHEPRVGYKSPSNTRVTFDVVPAFMFSAFHIDAAVNRIIV